MSAEPRRVVTSQTITAPTFVTKAEPTAVIVPAGTIIVQQPFIRTSDYFENQGKTSDELLTLNLPKSENIEWSVDVKPPTQNHFSLKANITKTIAATRRTLALQHSEGNNLFQIRAGDSFSAQYSRSNAFLPGSEFDISLLAPTTFTSFSKFLTVASLTAKVNPLGLSTSLDYDLRDGTLKGWASLYQSLLHPQTGNQIGVGVKGEFIGNALKAAQFGGSFKRNTFEAFFLANLTNLRSRPSNLSISFLDTLRFSGRAYDATLKLDHNLDSERTTTSFAILDKQLKSKFRVNSNGLVGVASTHTFVGGSLSITMGLDFDLNKKNSASSVKVSLV